MEKKLKIVYIGNFSENSIGEPEIAKSLEECGYEVIRVSEQSSTIEEVKEKIKNCDLLLFAKFRVGNPRERWDFLKDLDIPKVCWIFDLYFGL